MHDLSNLTENRDTGSAVHGRRNDRGLLSEPVFYLSCPTSGCTGTRRDSRGGQTAANSSSLVEVRDADATETKLTVPFPVPKVSLAVDHGCIDHVENSS